MTNEERDIQRKLRVLQHAEKIGNARKACRYSGVGRSSFYRWREAYQKYGDAGLKNAKSTRKHTNNGMLSPVDYETEQKKMKEKGVYKSRGTSIGHN